MNKVFIDDCEYENCYDSIKKIFYEFPLDIKNKKILIKPNVVRGAKPEEAITTHPKILSSVIDILETFNPKEIIVGDNCGLQNNEECFEQCGLIEASKGYYKNIDNEKDAYKIKLNNSKVPFIKLSKEIIEADLIISLPKFKTHSLTIISGSIKNSYGFLPGKQKNDFHKIIGNTLFQNFIVDVYKVRPPDLIIMDAIIGMEGNGPASFDLRTINKIIASDNGVCLDSVVSYMMGMRSNDILFLKKSYEENLGEIDINKINIIGELIKIKNFKLPSINEHYIGWLMTFESKKEIKHYINKETCNLCKTCIEHCPVDALDIKNNSINVNSVKCIYCFCCQELCPNKSMTIK